MNYKITIIEKLGYEQLKILVVVWSMGKNPVPIDQKSSLKVFFLVINILPYNYLDTYTYIIKHYFEIFYRHTMQGECPWYLYFTIKFKLCLNFKILINEEPSHFHLDMYVVYIYVIESIDISKIYRNCNLPFPRQ